MKSPLLVAALSAAFFSLTALAQLGPAGVPGAPGLAETDPSVTAVKPVPAQPSATPAQSVSEKESSQPKRTKGARKSEPGTVCPSQAGKRDRRCAPKASTKNQCNASADPVRCELYAKARAICKDKRSNDAYRQCLRETLVPKP